MKTGLAVDTLIVESSPDHEENTMTMKRKPNLLLTAASLLSTTLTFTASAGNVQKKGSPIQCKFQVLMDQATQLPAFTYLVPKGWVAKDMFAWGKPGQYNAWVTASSPDQQYHVTQLESQVYSFNAPYYPPGARADHAPVHHATDFLREVLRQIVGGDAQMTDVQVVQETNSPIPDDKLPAWVARTPTRDAMGSKVPVNEYGFLQVKYVRNGTPVVAMLGTTIKGSVATKILPGRNIVTAEFGVFGTGPTTVLVMPENAPAAKQKEVGLVAGSIQMHPKFQAYYRALITRMGRIKLGEFKAEGDYANATFHERTMSQFNEQMHMKDAYSHAFCNYISDLQDYKDQQGRTVTAPAAYQFAYSDGRGDYLFNSDATTDLRGFGGGDWKPMEKARIGE